MLIVIDGPEKTGKTTFVRRLAEASRPFHVVRFNCRRPEPFDVGFYVEALRLATRSDVFVLMDRSWAAEAAYSRLLNRPTPVTREWLAWCLDLPAMTLGLLLLAAPPARLALLDGTDHPVSWDDEVAAFKDATLPFGWIGVDLTFADPRKIVDFVKTKFQGGPRAPVWAGAQDPQLVVVGERRNTRSREPLAWGPLTTRFWNLELRARLLADIKIAGGWDCVGLTNAADLGDADVQRRVAQAPAVVAYGRVAQQAVGQLRADAVCRVHPAFSYRWKNQKGEQNVCASPSHR